MKKVFLSLFFIPYSLFLSAQIDMQAHAGSDEGLDAYDYTAKQAAYYSETYTYENLLSLQGDELFGALNTLMGKTNKIKNGYSYDKLKYNYSTVDVDLNNKGNAIIGYYDGASLSATWDPNNNYNREHTWPQSKGADKGIPMGHDMQSVRPANVKVNSDRGNTAYGEGSAYYDPNSITINNSYYQNTNLGTYRGDAARVIAYDYIVYGQAGSYKNGLYNGNAQLLNKLGTSGVFESIEILLKWHMQDPPSLTEVTRNDGAHAYQGNRNPFIDYPELAIQMFKNSVTTYAVEKKMTEPLWPNYQLTLKHGFIAYVGEPGAHPDKVAVTGATSNYDAATGRLVVSNVTDKVSISTGTTGVEDVFDTTAPDVKKVFYNGQLYIIRDGNWYDVTGRRID